MRKNFVKKHKLLFSTLLLFGMGSALALLPGLFRTSPNTAKVLSASTPPQRIICASPAVTELVFALGCGARVVAVSDFCNYPPEAKQKPRIGGFINPNYEQIIAVKPDVIIYQGRHEKIRTFCSQYNIATIGLEVSDIETIFNDIKLLGDKLGSPEKANALCIDIQKSLEQIKTTVAGTHRPKVFLSLGRVAGSTDSLSTAGASTFLSELIEIAGGRNIFGDITLSYPKISKESLIKRQPEIIIEPRFNDKLTEQFRSRLLADWLELSLLPAVKNSRVYFPTDDSLLIPGPRVAQAAQLLAELIHPELFNE